MATSVTALLLAATALPATPEKQAERFLERLAAGDLTSARAALPRHVRFTSTLAQIRAELATCELGNIVEVEMMAGAEPRGLIASYSCPSRPEDRVIYFFMVDERIVRVMWGGPIVPTPAPPRPPNP